MAWLESHDDIWEHFKLDRLQTMLAKELPEGLDTDEQRVLLVGHLHSLWHFTLKNAWRNADLSPWGDSGIERASKWRRKPGAFIHALRESGLLDDHTPHGWMERAGDLVKKRLDRESVRREKLGNLPAGAVRPPSGETTGSQRCATVQDKPDNQDRNAEDKPDVAPSPADSKPPLLVFGCAGKVRDWALTESKVAEWSASYPGVDVLAECRKARQWCLDNPTKKKTAGGMASFLGRWLSRVQDGASMRPGAPTAAASGIRPPAGKYDGISKTVAASVH